MRAMKICGGIASALALTVFAIPAMAQQDEGGPMTWGEDAQYDEVQFVKFKPGKRERAMELIDEYFIPASEKAGTAGPAWVEHFQTGKWDMLLVWHLAGGTGDLKWYRSEDNIKWMAALAELNGGAEAAGKLWDEYIATVAESVTELGHHHSGMSE
jgi:hypothetical protein